MDELRTALIVLGALFVGGLALWERRNAARRARSTMLPEHTPSAAPPMMSRRMEPSMDDFSVPGPAAELDTLEVPTIHPLEPMRVDVSRESAVDVPSAARMEAAPAPARAQTVAIRWPPAHTERVLSLRVVRTDGGPLLGRTLRQALESAGLQPGPQRIYHLVDSEGHVLASAANLVRPGSLVPEEMDASQYRGLSLFSILPGPLPAMQILEGLIRVARDIAARNEALVQDEQGAVLDAERLTQLRRSVQAYAEAGESPP
jgi:FtsZ-interacting cell division protein ZipA